MTCPAIGTERECPKIGTESECLIDGQLCSSRGWDMKADGVDILWEDDEGNEQVEEIRVGTTKEVGSILTSLLTVKEIVVRHTE